MKTIYKLTLFFTFLISAGNVFAQQTEREKGLALYKQGSYTQAVSVLENVSRQKEAKNDAEVWNYLGLSYIETNDLKKARKALEKAVKLNPQSADYRVNLGYAYLSSRKLDQAQSEINKAIGLDPKNIGAYYIRGTASLWEGKIDNALADADKIIVLDKNYTGAYLLKSDALVALFGKNISEGEAAKGEIGYLQKSIETLESCLKNCQNNQNLKSLNERLEAVTAFYNYFNRSKPDDINQALTASANKTPIKILNKPNPRYTDNARSSLISGEIRLYVLFAASGKVSHVIVLKKLGYGLDEQAVNAARQITFEPATENGKPVSVVKMVSYTFTVY